MIVPNNFDYESVIFIRLSPNKTVEYETKIKISRGTEKKYISIKIYINTFHIEISK